MATPATTVLTEALQRCELIVSLAEQVAGVGSFELGPHPGKWRWSAEACRIMAVTPDRPPSNPDAFIAQIVHPDDRMPVADALRGAVTAQTARQVEFRMPMAEGTDKVLRMAVAPVPSNGEVVLQCVALDITARTRTEQALAEYRREVWHIGRVATAGAMATAMAHELNQPLAAITHTAQACRRLLAAGQLGTPDLAQNLVVISEQAMRASEIIKNIRSFVRKTPDRKGPVDVARLVHDAVRLAGPLARQSGIDIEVDIDRLDPTLSITGDELQLGQMLFNLVRNAEDAVAGNPRSQRHIKITAATNGNRRVRVDVSDNGPGIAPEARSRIFEPFFTTRKNGLGMGLAISQTIAEAHGAVLGLASAGGCGSGAVFSIEFLADND